MRSWTIKLRRSLLFLLIIGANFGLSQEKGFVIGPGSVNDLQMRSGSMSYIENRSSGSLDPSTLVNRKLRILKTSVPNFGFIPHDVWFRTQLKNNTNRDQEFYLILSNANLDKAHLHIFTKNGGAISTQQFSDLSPYSSRENNTRKPVFKIKIPKNEHVVLLLSVNNGGEQFHFDLKFKDLQHLHASENSESYFLGFFMGILLFTILLNTYMFILTKDRLSMYYSLYLIALFFLQGSLLGFGKIYLWPDSEFMSNHANPLFASISVYFLLYFVRYYLNLNVHLERMDKVLKWITLPVLIAVILSCIPHRISYEASVILINALTLILNLLILPVAFVVYRKGYKPALLFLIAFLILVISVFAFILKNFGVIPSTFVTDFGFQIGSAAEVLLFSLGIIIRFRNVQREAITRLKEVNRMKEEANEELERKVVERTQEIEDQKTEIEAKNKEIISSIAYARRIQEAILPDTEKVQRILPNVQLLYRPKDIVSGDFIGSKKKSGVTMSIDFLLWPIALATVFLEP
jgi:two-component system, sensor histidine kinase LadS